MTGTVSAVQAISGWKSSQDCEGGRDPGSGANLAGSSLQKSRGDAQFQMQEYEHYPETHCTQEIFPAVQVDDCTPVFKTSHSVLDWRGVGGVVHNRGCCLQLTSLVLNTVRGETCQCTNSQDISQTVVEDSWLLRQYPV